MKVARVVSGYRPTGKLHLGHYHGTLTNWIRMQDEYECFFFVADWHALTTRYDDVAGLQEDINEMIIDWVAAGLNPEKCVIFKQSSVPEVAELSLYLSMLTPLAWLERCPTYKEQLRELRGKEIATHGFVGYPVLQTADIILYHGEFVPVGEDQLPHLELAREIVRRFNNLYGDYFPEPQPLLSPIKKLLGIDGRKMSKSYNNAINLSDSPSEIRRKIRMAITDPQRVYRTDLGHPDICLVFSLHELYSSHEIQDIREKCEKAVRGCTDCKDLLAERISDFHAEFREKRTQLEREPGLVGTILERGAERARPIAGATLREVRRRINV
ncbi:MAG: tryptophan--tRNA ligase [Actinomycetota bacterium]|nr:tryptophan--tRNA ligase [Actinomycetota bacterium]